MSHAVKLRKSLLSTIRGTFQQCVTVMGIPQCMFSTHHSQATFKVNSVRLNVEKDLKKKKNSPEVYHFATNKPFSYWANSNTAPIESNYWSSCDTFIPSLSEISVWAAAGMTVISCSCPNVFQKQLGGTYFELMTKHGWQPRTETELLFATVIQTKHPHSAGW